LKKAEKGEKAEKAEAERIKTPPPTSALNCLWAEEAEMAV